MRREVFCLLGAALGGMFLTAAAWAQNSPGTIVATGTERVRVQPKAIRLVCEVRAEGKTAEEAVRNLQGQRETMSARLKELGADGDSIDFTPAALEQGCLTPYYPFIAPETTSSPSDNESGYVPSPPAQSSNPFAPSPPAPPAAPAGIPPAGTTPDALPTPGRDESSQYTPGRPAPAPSLSSTSAGRRTYAPGPATLPPPATSVAPATGYGVSSLAQAAPVVGPYPRAANPPAVTIMPAASATSSSGDPEPTLVPAPTPPPAGAYLVPGPAPLGAVQQADPPRIPGASGGSESQAALGLNQPVGGGRVPGMSGGSEGQPGWGPSQPMPSPMDNARRARFVARTTLTAKWPINASKPDDVALSMEKLREKLIAANLVGDGFSQPPAAGIPIPQAAIVRSMPAQLLPVPANSYGGPSVAVRNDGLRLECVGLLSKADRKDALSAAMTKARQHAAELAEAAGCHLGPLASVSGGVDNYSTPVMTSNVGVPPRNDGEYLGLPELPDLTVSVTLHFQIAP